MTKPSVAEGRHCAIREMINRQRADPAYQKMIAEMEERHRCLRQKLSGVDVVTLDQNDWMEWLSVHHSVDRDRAKGRRAQHRHALKMTARAEGQPWQRNDPRVREAHTWTRASDRRESN